jgi:hypothetical protein
MREVETHYVTPRKQMYRYGAGQYILHICENRVQKRCIFKCIRFKNEMG